MSELEKAQANIKRIGKIIFRACFVVKIILIVMIVGQAALTFSVYLNPKAAVFLGERLDDSFLFHFLRDAANLDSLEPKYVATIGSAVLMVSYFAVFMMIKTASALVKPLAKGERPFDVATAQKTRKRAFYLLFFIFYNPVLAIVSFTLVMLFSYIMEYGGYIQERADETNRILEEMIMSLAEISENKSGQTGQHIKRVSEYAKILADQLGLPTEESEMIRIASTMHDVGKIMIPSEILEKPGKLTDEEYAVIKTHTTLGGKLLENVEGEEMKLSRTIALQHHERYDGKGYPSQLAGDSISMEGRIVAVADVYDALTSKRSYKNAWKEEDAFQEIVKGRGTQFDPRVVDAFVAAHDKIIDVRKKYRL